MIPAHNEEDCIGSTIDSFRAAVIGKARSFQDSEIQIMVASNGSIDRTVQICQEQNVSFVDWPAIGKWQTLAKVVRQNDAVDYFFFVDAGTVVPANFFGAELSSAIFDPSVMGFTLNYQSTARTRLEKIYWFIEATFKVVEKKMGGLVAVSGFLVGYSGDELRRGIQFLTERFATVNWLNDDVVLPLTLRIMNLDKSIHLVSGLTVADVGLEQDHNELARRERMLRGNIQWIKLLLPHLLVYPSGSGLQKILVMFLVLRRVLKIFWGYVLLLIIVTPIILIPNNWKVWGALLSISAVAVSWKSMIRPKLWPALLASLKAPVWLFKSKEKLDGQVNWK